MTHVKHSMNPFASMTKMRKGTIKVFYVAAKFFCHDNIFLMHYQIPLHELVQPLQVTFFIDSFISWQRTSLFSLFVKKYASGIWKYFFETCCHNQKYICMLCYLDFQLLYCHNPFFPQIANFWVSLYLFLDAPLINN